MPICYSKKFIFMQTKNFSFILWFFTFWMHSVERFAKNVHCRTVLGQTVLGYTVRPPPYSITENGWPIVTGAPITVLPLNYMLRTEDGIPNTADQFEMHSEWVPVFSKCRLPYYTWPPPFYWNRNNNMTLSHIRWRIEWVNPLQQQYGASFSRNIGWATCDMNVPSWILRTILNDWVWYAVLTYSVMLWTWKHFWVFQFSFPYTTYIAMFNWMGFARRTWCSSPNWSEQLHVPY